jgi:SAM-dependent methyltransferase
MNNLYLSFAKIRTNLFRKGDLHTTVIFDTYEGLAKRTTDIAALHFMNYGYASTAEEKLQRALRAEDEELRYPTQLYLNVVDGFDFTGLKVLEVGSGRGGGSDVIKRYCDPLSVTGLELSPQAVALANRDFGGEGIGFREGDAHRLPFNENEFDVVVNVESSHCYTHANEFYSEVNRVLKPGGHFLFTDFRYNKGIIHTRNLLRDSTLKLLSYEDITANIIRALDKDNYRRMELVDLVCSTAAERLQYSVMYGVKGTPLYRDFLMGKRSYFRMVLQKAA